MRSFKIIILLIWCFGQYQTGYGQKNSDLAQYIDATFDPSAIVGLSIINTDGKEVMGYNAHKLLTPASTAKLITTTATIHYLGSDYRYETKLYYRGQITDSKLIGDVIIVGDGDPTLGSDRHNLNGNSEQWIKDISSTLKAAGIQCVDGRLLIDVSQFNGASIPSKWVWEDLGNYYGSGSWGLNLNENRIYVTLSSPQKRQGSTKLLHIDPYIPYLRYHNQVTTSQPDGRDMAYIFGVPHQYNRSIDGSIPSGKSEFTIKGSLPNPPYDIGRMIVDQLPELFPQKNIEVIYEGMKEMTMLKTYRSKPLIDLVTAANYKSINIYCDAFLRSISKESGGDGSIDHGLKKVNAFLKSLGITDTHKIYDGSGLSPFNLVSPHMLSTLIHDRMVIDNLDHILPQVGKDGTVTYLLRNDSVAKKYRLKSGSMENVLSYAGTLHHNGRSYAITIIVNNSIDRYKTVKSQIEKLLKKVITYL